eukprot:GEMP01081818.1.p1 GENE.GEMP01081818.1~~GEMP01081818.1.p1  ORF type:complete len:127 (+),score=34.98 GEMP01081818.1:123-503(+)
MATVRELKAAFEESGCAPEILQELICIYIQKRDIAELQRETAKIRLAVETFGNERAISQGELEDSVSLIRANIAAKDDQLRLLKEANEASFDESRSLLGSIVEDIQQTRLQVENAKVPKIGVEEKI